MSVIADTEVVVREVGRWQPSDVACIRRFSFENWDGPSFDLALRLLLQPRPPLSAGWPDPNGLFWEVDVGFQGVRDLHLTLCGPWDIQTAGFAIDDIRDRQWDGVNLLVYDYEGLPSGSSIRFGSKCAVVRGCRRAHRGPDLAGLWREYPGVFGEES
jgi:hypothetical protein